MISKATHIWDFWRYLKIIFQPPNANGESPPLSNMVYDAIYIFRKESMWPNHPHLVKFGYLCKKCRRCFRHRTNSYQSHYPATDWEKQSMILQCLKLAKKHWEVLSRVTNKNYSLYRKEMRLLRWKILSNNHQNLILLSKVLTQCFNPFPNILHIRTNHQHQQVSFWSKFVKRTDQPCRAVCSSCYIID